MQLTVHQSILRSGYTYEVCDTRGLCRKRDVVVPPSSRAPTSAGRTATPAESQVAIARVDFPGKATDYSRVPVRAVVKDGKGRIVGRGQATFPEYPPIRTEECTCYEALVQLDVHPSS
ncbi:hypothetical protein ABZU32_30145 [Sphaerisporangium sp. NPDC005288]|uniref:hypothetical protein n=1 Tax=Sphaerisporangium sp. NPDC005288 TaxID=3155114 RepID=UPI0033A0EFF3